MKITKLGILKALDCHLLHLSHFILAWGILLLPLIVPQTLVSHGLTPIMLLVGCFAMLIVLHLWQLIEYGVHDAFDIKMPDEVIAHKIFALVYVGVGIAATINEPAHTTSAYIALGILWVVGRAIMDFCFEGNPLSDWTTAKITALMALLKSKRSA